MITACSGRASPIRKIVLLNRRNGLRPPRTIANAAMNETSTAGTVAPIVTITEFVKYLRKSASSTAW
jgi:hypothetical protein